MKGALGNFNLAFGERIVSSLKPLGLENYQDKREEEGRAPATIDMEISLAKTMVTKAFDNDLVDGKTVKAFRKLKRKLRRAANARRRILTMEEYVMFLNVAPPPQGFPNLGYQYRDEAWGVTWANTKLPLNK